MRPAEVIRNALNEVFTDEDARPVYLKLEPGMSVRQVAELEDSLQLELPEEIRELLLFTSGFEFEPVGYVDFCDTGSFGFEEMFPVGLPLFGDGSGNFWVQDIRRDTGAWAGVFFVCHDPPVTVVQARSLAEFLEQIFDLGRPPHRSQLTEVRASAVHRIWRDDRLLTVEDVGAVTDASLSAFAGQLEKGWGIADLRSAEVGVGFSWGRNGPETIIRRHQAEPIFAVKTPKRRGVRALLARERKSR